MSGSSTCRSGAAAARAGSALLAPGGRSLALGAAPPRRSTRERAMSQYIRDQWGSESGFPGGPVYAIAQTADGYLWIGAEKGLVRFDGLTFRLFDAGAGRERRAGRARRRRRAPTAACGRGCAASALVRYHDGVFDDLLAGPGAPRSVVTAMARGAGRRDAARDARCSGAVAYRGGRFDADRGRRRAAELVVRHRDRREPRTATSGWARRDAGLFRVQRPQVTRYTTGLPDLKINCLLAGPAGDVWIGTDRGVVAVERHGDHAGGHAGRAARTLRRWRMIARPRRRTSGSPRARDGLLRVSRGRRGARGGRRGRAARARRRDLRGSRRQPLGRHRPRHRALARPRVHDLLDARRACRPTAAGPSTSTPTGASGSRPSSGGLFWLRDGVVHRVHAGRAAPTTSSIRSHGGGDDVWVGRQRGGLTRAARRRRRHRGRALHAARRPGAGQRLSPSTATRDGAVWAGTLSGGVSRSRTARSRPTTRANGLAVEHRRVDARRRATARCGSATPNGVSALLARRLAHLHDRRRPAVERRQHAVRGSPRRRLGRHGRRPRRRRRRAACDRRRQRAGRCAASILGLRRGSAAARSGSTTADGVLRVNREAADARRARSRTTCASTASPTGCSASKAVKRHRSVVADAQRADLVRADARAVDGRSGARRRARRCRRVTHRRAADRRRRAGRRARRRFGFRPAGAGSPSATPA